MRPGKFSNSSIGKLQTCHPNLIRLCDVVVLGWDCTVLYGHRTKEEQEKAFEEGRTMLHWPDSMHNKLPSLAVDLAPWHSEEKPPVDWYNTDRWRSFGGFVMGIAFKMGLKVRWGGDWDGDWTFTDQRLIDLPHFGLLI